MNRGSTADVFDVPAETLQFPTMPGAFLIYRFPFLNNTGSHHCLLM